jgi:hypothetical protein
MRKLQKANRRQMLQALKQSIEHWHVNLLLAYAGELSDEDIRGSNCACCNLSYKIQNRFSCSNCILLIDMHCNYGCLSSPWSSVSEQLPMTLKRRSGIIKSVIHEIKFLEQAYLESSLRSSLRYQLCPNE